jgi:hypothetical protein
MALIIHRAMRMRRIVICGLTGCAIFFHIISSTARFSKKKALTQNVRLNFLYSIFLERF